MPEEITKLTLALPKTLDEQLHKRLYGQYPEIKLDYNAYLVAVLRAWVNDPTNAL